MDKIKTKEELEQELAELRKKVQENIEINKLKEEIYKIKHPGMYKFRNMFSNMGESMKNIKTNAKNKMFP